MKLLITKDKNFLELDDNVVMKKNDFGVWFWDDFYNIYAKKVLNPIFENYNEIYEDFILNKRVYRESEC